ncbi:hypothetical protein H257_15707 [Aphanomyces astaci]|uniref:Uncharacterized protein n=1 Tax=Aphanomyces astaci TaxID=112090 RepID=W4FNH0_APHAT|nr:hypothetical protein H257_15707 [Aphanomyces astaci]ETV68394.1 hypothetical protein H257_15707 [Aphanomyces astaci]|eukprot:XP_009842189.1 hypothetical protein H257_15707 [Aphanomyces astaci]
MASASSFAWSLVLAMYRSEDRADLDSAAVVGRFSRLFWSQWRSNSKVYACSRSNAAAFLSLARYICAFRRMYMRFLSRDSVGDDDDIDDAVTITPAWNIGK